MSTVSDLRRPRPATKRRRSRGLGAGLGQLGTRGNSNIARALSHPLADYYLVLVSASLLVGLGVLMVLSASSPWSSVTNQGDAYYYLVRQLVFLCIGIPVAWWLSRRGEQAYMVFGWLGLIGSIGLLALIFTPLGLDAYGNRSWLQIPLLGTIQPSEFAKAALILWSAAVLANRTKTLNDPKRLLFPFLVGFGVIEGMVLLQKDLGTALLIALIMFAMLWFVGAPMRVVAALGAAGALLVGALVVTDTERMHRLFSFMNPGEASSDQPMNAIYALASGGWWGEGLGRSRQKWGGLYNGAQTDYVLAVLGEEMGLFGTLFVLVLFFVLAFTGLRIAARSSSRFLSYAAGGMTAWLTIQALINVFVVMRLLPVVGVPLPFLSQGGSALLANLIAVGILLGAARQEPEAAKLLAAGHKGRPPKMTSVVDTRR
ncbi:putative peptidoglycan glycosyltransferase FtsW [Propionimicrobium sp. PCR01-08-3]|uniref:peptidoglycan glycosyltransferase FtsW n=1 Tax=Propionimicrobium sp. PCR01-08-3 TaxID=3052086 RepID=UPI00255C3678|nr:putative peptidoglycan glycosyltransferase FtsW [Propionimicrobium sp. PCR01-08-3]WIY81646.1 putative peptidoglycan glycosyltransferase FtsW [Propionimicrobium sp. PCR01-08-3]